MRKTWKEIKAELDAETKKIWLKEPEEITLLRNGIVPSGSGSYGQYFSTWVFASGDMRALGSWVTPPAILHSMEDPSFTLDQCKKLWKWISRTGALMFLGYCGFKKMEAWGQDIEDSFDTVKTKEEWRALMESWLGYVNRMYLWIHHCFPWGVGAIMLRKTPEEIERLAKLVSKIRREV